MKPENLQGYELLEKHESNVAFVTSRFNTGGVMSRAESKPIIEIKEEVLRRLKIYDQLMAGELQFSLGEDGNVHWLEY